MADVGEEYGLGAVEFGERFRAFTFFVVCLRVADVGGEVLSQRIKELPVWAIQCAIGTDADREDRDRHTSRTDNRQRDGLLALVPEGSARHCVEVLYIENLRSLGFNGFLDRPGILNGEIKSRGHCGIAIETGGGERRFVVVEHRKIMAYGQSAGLRPIDCTAREQALTSVLACTTWSATSRRVLRRRAPRTRSVTSWTAEKTPPTSPEKSRMALYEYVQ